MNSELINLFSDLNASKLRVERPRKFIFLCGGALGDDQIKSRARNLRDYLYRIRKFRPDYGITLAETATQLYRDTHYSDLISFEEDLARIASVVLVIAESAGSLAELGAFSSVDSIRRALRIIIQDKHANAESFVRYGPVRRVENDNREHIGVYPWRSNKNGLIVIRSIRPHYKEIVRFINDHVTQSPSSISYNSLKLERDFYIIYWIVHICIAISPNILQKYAQAVNLSLTWNEIKNRLYCMRLAGWVDVLQYSGKDYYFSLFERDPFNYSFKSGVTNRDSIRRKAELSIKHQKIEKLPRYVIRTVQERRGSVKP